MVSMHKVNHKVPGLSGVRLTSPQAKPPTPRHSAISAVPADAPAFICTSQAGIVTCTDEAGSPVQGEQLKQLQALLKPIADAPALVDEPVQAKGQSMPSTVAPAPEPKLVAQAKPAEGPRPAAASAAPSMSQVSAPVDATEAPTAAPTTTSQPPAAQPSPPTPASSPSTPSLPSAPETSVVKAVSDTPAQPQAVAEPPAATPASKADSQARPAQTKKASPPTTLATPDLSPKSPGSDVRAIAVSRGNDESVSFSAPPPAPAPPAAAPSGSGSLIPGNSSATPAAPAPPVVAPTPVSRPAGKFPGNVDPADYLPEEDFGKPTVTVASAKAPEVKPAAGNQVKRLDIVNEKGLIPGNMQMELGEIVNLLQAVNAEPIKYLNYKVYPGNVPPDAPLGTPASTVLEFSPGNAPPKGGDMKSVKMELAPGNIPPDLGDMIDFLKGNES